MLTHEGCQARRGRLLEAIPGGCDLVIVADPSHLLYLAGYHASPFTFRSQESAAVLAFSRDQSVLIGDDMVGPFLEQAHVDRVAAPSWYNGETAAPHRRALLVDSTLGVLESLPGARIGVELAAVPAGVVEGLRKARPGVAIVDVSRVIRTLRRAKDADEVEVMRRAIAAGAAGHAAALREARPGMTELEIYQLAREAAEQSLGEPAIVYGDFVSGPRIATEKGGPPTARKIERGDLLLLDFSVRVGGYRGDFTNTFVVGAPAPPEVRALHDACLAALAAGEQAVKAGVPARAVDHAVRAAFESRGLAQHFTTHVGHGIGLGHPEPPYLVARSDETLVAGDVLAIEPGLYIPGTAGMRMERNYLVTCDGFELLSRHEIRIDQP